MVVVVGVMECVALFAIHNVSILSGIKSGEWEASQSARGQELDATGEPSVFPNTVIWSLLDA